MQDRQQHARPLKVAREACRPYAAGYGGVSADSVHVQSRLTHGHSRVGMALVCSSQHALPKHWNSWHCLLTGYASWRGAAQRAHHARWRCAGGGRSWRATRPGRAPGGSASTPPATAASWSPAAALLRPWPSAAASCLHSPGVFPSVLFPLNSHFSKSLNASFQHWQSATPPGRHNQQHISALA